jgi:hypothetical protein
MSEQGFPSSRQKFELISLQIEPAGALFHPTIRATHLDAGLHRFHKNSRTPMELLNSRLVTPPWVGCWHFGATPGAGGSAAGAVFFKPRSQAAIGRAPREHDSSSLPLSWASGRCAAPFFPTANAALSSEHRTGVPS